MRANIEWMLLERGPKSRRARRATAFLTVLASLACANSCDRERTADVTTTSKARLAQCRTARDPFTQETWNLPHYVAPCGFHSPRYLDSEIAREAIERAFAEAGCNLLRRYPFQRDGITIIADGYDPVQHVGYIYATYDNLDVDAFQTSLPSLRDDPDSPDNAEEIESRCRQLAFDAEQDNDLDLYRLVQRIERLTDREQRLRAGYEIIWRDRPTRLSLVEAKKLAARLEETGEFVAVISHFDQRFAVPNCDDAPDEYREAFFLPDPAKYDAMREAIGEKLARQTAESLRAGVGDYLSWVSSAR